MKRCFYHLWNIEIYKSGFLNLAFKSFKKEMFFNPIILINA